MSFHIEHKDGPRAKWKPLAGRFSTSRTHDTLAAALSEARRYDQDGYIDATMRIVQLLPTGLIVVPRDQYNLPADREAYEGQRGAL